MARRRARTGRALAVPPAGAGACERPESDPADELRVRLEQAREAPDDRDEFDAAEGQPVDEVGAAPLDRGAAAGDPRARPSRHSARCTAPSRRVENRH